VREQWKITHKKRKEAKKEERGEPGDRPRICEGLSTTPDKRKKKMRRVRKKIETEKEKKGEGGGQKKWEGVPNKKTRIPIVNANCRTIPAPGLRRREEVQGLNCGGSTRKGEENPEGGKKL